MAKRITYNFSDNTQRVEEFEVIPPTEEEIKKEREQEIKKELVELDVTINRATEDLYELTNVTPYESVQEAINRKIELRNELKTLKKGEM